jgi:hypothetical protein
MKYKATAETKEVYKDPIRGLQRIGLYWNMLLIWCLMRNLISLELTNKLKWTIKKR